MQFFDVRTSRILATILLFGLVLAFVYLAWRTLVAFLFAILFAYLLEPLVARIEQRFHLRRTIAVTLVYVALTAVAGGFLFFLGPKIVQQASRLSGQMPELSQRIATGQIVQQIGSQRGWSLESQQRLEDFLSTHRIVVARGEQAFLGEIAQVAANATWVVLVPILGIFFLLSEGRYSQSLLEQVTRRRQRAFVGSLLDDIHAVLASYIRAQITLTALAVAVYLVAFELLRLPYAVALAVVAGLLEFIPVVGPLVAALLVLGTAFLLNYGAMIALLVFLGAWRLTQDYFNSPRIMGGQVQLPPLVVLFGALAGAEMAGVVGVYLSVPAMATLRVLWLHWRHYRGADDAAASSAELHA